MTDFVKAINITTEEWALIVSILALVSTIILNIVSYRVSQNALKLELKKYEEERTEREKNVLDITVWHSNRWGGDHGEPLRWLGVWLKINNRSDEQPLLVGIDVELDLVQENRQFHKNLLIDFFMFLFEKPKKSIYSFSLYRDSESYKGNINLPQPIMPTFLPYHFYLMDWESKAPIVFAPQKEYRMLLPKEKKIWLLFGIIPSGVADWINEPGLSLDEIRIFFVTDQGEITVSEKLNTHLLSMEQLKEYLGYKFDFEKLISNL